MKGPRSTCYDERRDQWWALPFNSDVDLLFCNRSLVGDGPWTADALSILALPPGASARYLGQYTDSEAFTVNVLEALQPTVRGDDVFVAPSLRTLYRPDGHDATGRQFLNALSRSLEDAVLRRPHRSYEIFSAVNS